jgi:hypothetical protein
MSPIRSRMRGLTTYGVNRTVCQIGIDRDPSLLRFGDGHPLVRWALERQPEFESCDQLNMTAANSGYAQNAAMRVNDA